MNDADCPVEQALQLGAARDKPRLQGALGKLLRPSQRERAVSLVRSALADLPDGAPDADELKRWLARHADR